MHEIHPNNISESNGAPCLAKLLVPLLTAPPEAASNSWEPLEAGVRPLEALIATCRSQTSITNLGSTDH